MQGLVVSADWDPRAGYPVTAEEIRRQRAVLGSEVWRNPVWAVAERPDPRIGLGDDVLIRTRACGLCGSDVHLHETDAEGYVLLPYRTHLPIAIGHELSGEVVEVGPDVTRVRPGDAVAVEAMTYCGSCRACLRGLYNLCDKGENLGGTMDGGTGQYVVARERHCWPLNEIRDRVGEQRAYDIGAVIEPTSIAYNAMFLRGGGFRPGDHVGVFGCGPVGLAAVALARACGASKIVAIDTQPSRRETAIRMGADLAIDPLATPDVGDQINDFTTGIGVGMAIEASGVGFATMSQIEIALGLAGKVILIGLDMRPVPMSTVALQMKAAEIYSSLGHLGGGFEAVIGLHNTGRIDVSQMVTSRYNLAEGLQAIEKSVEGSGSKVLIYPNG